MIAAFPRIIRLFVIAVILSTTLALSSNPVPVTAQEAVLLEDQFDSNDNDWELSGLNEDYVDFDIDDGVLAITVDRDDSGAWTFVTPDETFPNDVDVMVDVESPNGEDAYWYAALMLRSDLRQDDDDEITEYYHFEVTSKGEWGFAARWDDPDDKDKDDKTIEYNLIKSGELSRFDAEDKHTLAVSARGSEFEFVIDGKKVGTFEDDSVNDDNDPKYVGVLAGTLEGHDDDVTITFDNFTVQGEGEGNANNNSSSGGSVLLQDNFEDNTNKWPLADGDKSSVELEDNALRISVFEGTDEGWISGASPSTKFDGDVDVTVTATLDEGDSKGAWQYGIAPRYYRDDDKNHYYLFYVTSDSEWVFTHYDGTEFNTIDEGQLEDFDPEASNKLNVIAVGDSFEFFVNGKKVGAAEDDSLGEQASYSVMLIGSVSDDKSSVAVNFSDFIVLKP